MTGMAASSWWARSMMDCPPRLKMPTLTPVLPRLRVGMAWAVAGFTGNPTGAVAVPTRNLGKTGVKVGIFSLGGQSIIERAHQEDAAIPVIERALDLGVNYIDTSSIYGGPERWSEQYIGQVMKRRRQLAFLASKTKERTRDGSLRMLEKSLELLHTDHLDCWQLH